MDIGSKKININQQYLQYGRKEKKQTKKNIINDVKGNNIKELLLKKLKEYKQNKNFKQNKNYIIDNNNSNNFHNKTNNFHNKTNNFHRINELPYGNLKNGNKPTFKQYKKNKTKKKITMQIEKKYNLGKNTTQKKIGVLIQKHGNKIDVENIKNEIKKKNMRTIKNCLKKQNLIKYGSYAPNELLREIYTNSQLCGCNIQNINKKSLLHNYMNDN